MVDVIVLVEPISDPPYHCNPSYLYDENYLLIHNHILTFTFHIEFCCLAFFGESLNRDLQTKNK